MIHCYLNFSVAVIKFAYYFTYKSYAVIVIFIVSFESFPFEKQLTIHFELLYLFVCICSLCLTRLQECPLDFKRMTPLLWNATTAMMSGSTAAARTQPCWWSVWFPPISVCPVQSKSESRHVRENIHYIFQLLRDTAFLMWNYLFRTAVEVFMDLSKPP